MIKTSSFYANRFPYRLKFCLAIFSFMLMSGCAVTSVKYEPVSKNVRTAEANFQEKISVGVFSRESENPLVDDPWTFRGATKFKSPVGAGHHDYIAKAIADELMLARKLDEDSTRILTGRLTEHKLATMGDGKGSIEVAFKLEKNGEALYNKAHRVDYSWDSSFVGGTAANKALRAYLVMVERLVFNLFSDAEFSNAVNE